MRISVIIVLAAASLIAAALTAGAQDKTAKMPAVAAVRASAATLTGPPARMYTTRFKHQENPISESGMWINGKKDGLDWADIRKAGGLAFGTEPGTVNYDDSTALLAGLWGPNQTVEAVVHTVKQKDGDIFEEVELRLRSSISAHNNTGYEVNFRCSGHDRGYNQIVRWNGRLGDFTILSSGDGGGVANGDVIKATIVGNVITVYRNGTQVNQVTDDTYSGGSPGMGFYLQGGQPSLNKHFGFTRFTATADW